MKEKIGIWNIIVSVLSLKSLALKSGDHLLLLLFVSSKYIPRYDIMSRKSFCESNIRAV